MSSAEDHHKINYIEFSTTDIARTKKFYATVFGWSFIDYGPEYSSFTAASAGIDGGFYKAGPHDAPPRTAPLVVLYSSNLKATEGAIVEAGGSIVVPTFDSPGGRRFHFSDGVGNVLAVWSEYTFDEYPRFQNRDLGHPGRRGNQTSPRNQNRDQGHKLKHKLKEERFVQSQVQESGLRVPRFPPHPMHPLSRIA